LRGRERAAGDGYHAWAYEDVCFSADMDELLFSLRKDMVYLPRCEHGKVGDGAARWSSTAAAPSRVLIRVPSETAAAKTKNSMGSRY
jgi:hypothetical protein